MLKKGDKVKILAEGIEGLKPLMQKLHGTITYVIERIDEFHYRLANSNLVWPKDILKKI